MERVELEQVVRNIDRRLERVEQILPTLATREELQAAIAPLATREEMHAAIQAAIAPLATREEMHVAIQAAVAPLATREEMHAAIQAAVAPLATREEVRAEARETRRHFDIIAESLRDDIRIIAEGLVALGAKFDRFRRNMERELTKVDGRLTALEARRRRR
jgi:uncharacterized protein YjaG (DUF416 family)